MGETMLDERLALGCVSGEKATAVPMRPNLTNKKLGEYFREVGGDLLARDDGHAFAAQVALAPCHVVGQVLVGLNPLQGYWGGMGGRVDSLAKG